MNEEIKTEIKELVKKIGYFHYLPSSLLARIISTPQLILDEYISEYISRSAKEVEQSNFIVKQASDFFIRIDFFIEFLRERHEEMCAILEDVKRELEYIVVQAHYEVNTIDNYNYILHLN